MRHAANHFLVLILVGLWIVASPRTARAQFTADLAGVPRAGVPFFSEHQTRTGLDLSAFRFARSGGRLTAARFGLDFGQSYRVHRSWELGYDLRLGEASLLKQPVAATPPAEPDSTATSYRGAALYGLAIGAKFSPISYLSPQGDGFETAIGVSYRPSLQPGYAFQTRGDSLLHGGVLGGSSSLPVGANLQSSFSVVAMGSYHSPRLLVDAALNLEKNIRSTSVSGTVDTYSGLTPQIGALVYLASGFAVGGTWWGSGAPPWRDRLSAFLPEEKAQSFGIVLGFGRSSSGGSRLTISSPTGKISKSVGLYLTVISGF